MIKRRKTRTVHIGRLKIGSGHPIAVQSMLKVPARRTAAARAQLKALEDAGCEIVRLAVEDAADAAAIPALKKATRLPLVADIHFDFRLALAAIEAGVDKVRLNPGNIFRAGEVRQVIAAARAAGIPIRVGANSGSLRVRRRDPATALVAGVRHYLKIFEKMRFRDIVISLKASSALETVRAYRLMARVCPYPFHLGVTATGLELDGIIKSSIGIGGLLSEGIGDTIRASLLEDPVREVAVAQGILSALDLRSFGPRFVCCPTCGRCAVDLGEKARALEESLRRLSKAERARIADSRIAIMGCVVNGPGEAREADLGVAFSKHKGALFAKGRIVKTVRFDQAHSALLSMIRRGKKA
ncbi:MAG: flavodoxin-dependent (E)-4-hydroxy-3-methylbut-2-enyl-diphosphate synthase [Deltaproteobacteria bacterium]